MKWRNGRDIMKTAKFLEGSGLIRKGVSQNKEQKDWFCGMILGTLGASLLGTMIAGKGILRAGYGNKGKRVKRGDEIVRPGYGFKMDFWRLIF